MAHSLSAKKRARQNVRRNRRNSAKRSTMRSAIKKTVAAIDAGDKEQAQAALAAVSSILDRYSHKGLIHKNKAARHKSRLNAKVKALSA
ncbi:MAG: 30S ribosomal protein S20 [Gammaproteobacteria bacterium]|nr:30S ribosomal protein S20 [Gammaproteobacteria bacterium]